MRTKFRMIVTFAVMLWVQFSFAQQRTVSGTVSDDKGMPLAGVSVQVKNTKNGTQTDFDGKYSISAAAKEVLVFSFVGMQTKEVVAASTSLNVSMQEDAKALEEVVVIGYGVQKKKEVTGSIAQIKGDAIQGLVTQSFDQQLSGRASGVQITQNSGLLGDAPRIRIRGVNSINSSTYPLIVVDGMPINTGDLGGYAVNNALADINPSDIESYEVLKDGAASAIYGSRAANGVIVITTKRGKQGRTKFNYNMYSGIASIVEKIDLLETNDFITINNEKRNNRGLANVAIGNSINTDWQDYVLRDAYQTDHSFSFNGGFDKGSYYASFGYTKQEGIIIANDMERFSLKLNADQKVTDKIKVGINTSVNKTTTNGLNTGTNSLSGAMFNVIRMLPNTSVYDPNGPYGYNIQTQGTNTIVGRGENLEFVANNLPNIRFVLDENIQNTINTRIIANGYASYQFNNWLSFRTQMGVDKSNAQGLRFWHPYHGDGVSSKGRIENRTDETESYNWQNQLNFIKSFGSHNVSATVVNEYQKNIFNGYWGGGTDLADAFYNTNTISGSYGTPLSGGYKRDNAIVSYLGRVSYDFNKKYFLQASIRKDIMSKFHPDLRGETFYGASAGWTISNESFFEPFAKYVSDLKLRASWGETGNFNIAGGDYPYLSTFDPRKYGDYNGIGFGQMGNPLVTWEVTEKTNFGIDFSILNNKVKVVADYFINRANRLVDNFQTAWSLGVPDGKYSANVGDIENKGWEFSVDANIFKTENMSLDINSNLTLVKNKVLALSNGADQIFDYNIRRVGEPLNALYGVKYWGVNPANGNPVYYRNDGSLVQGNISTNSYRVFNPNNPSDVSVAGGNPDFMVLGNVLPTYFGSFNITYKYKNFDLGSMIRFSGGNKIMNVTRREMLSQFFNNNSTEILGRWQSVDNPGDGWTPRLWSAGDPIVNGFTTSNSRFIEKGDFIKFDNITLGYSFSQDLIKKIKLESLRLYVQAQNAFMITKYKGTDPEMELSGVDYNAVPRSKVLSVGLNVGL